MCNKPRFLRQVFAILALAFLLAAVSAWVVGPQSGEPEITLFEALDLKPLWVDARPETEFAKGHIPGALLLNEDQWHGQLPALLEQWSGEQPVVVYCSTQKCRASHAVAKRLREEAGIEARVLKGGWEAWKGQ